MSEEVNEMSITLDSIKKELETHVGSKITVIAHTGRKQQTKRQGTLTETYPSIFVVDLDPKKNLIDRVSYSYSDILTQTVEISFNNEKK